MSASDRTLETETFRAQDFSFPRTKGPYAKRSFPRPSFQGTFVPGTFRSPEHSSPTTIIYETFRSQALTCFCRTVVSF